ncbi:MAG: flavin reductase [Clostridia bacterium]|nr:flavin reductase [Clostridia bacterium]
MQSTIQYTKWHATRLVTARRLRACLLATFANSEVSEDPTALFKLSYGLFVLTAKDGEKDNGCITNTAVQVASMPTQISVSVQKGNLTREMIEKTGKFNVSVLTEDVPYDVIRHFGMQSGRDVNKFENCENAQRSSNGIIYIPKYTNAYFSVKVVSAEDLGTHVQFIGEVTESKVLSDKPSCTYAHYHAEIKPKA